MQKWFRCLDRKSLKIETEFIYAKMQIKGETNLIYDK